MEDRKIYEDIALRTEGDIYIGVVGPVRTGKSTFIKRFMETAVIPNIENVYRRERARDELPQSGSGRTIMTAEPKFVPEEAVAVTMQDATFQVRLIDCVGYMVQGAVGHLEGESERMVTTPWFEQPIPMAQAAEIGTRKVIAEHSTIGIVITTDGTITEIPREDYLEAEERVICELKEQGKPFLVLVNSAYPKSERAAAVCEDLVQRYDVTCMAVNCLELSQQDIYTILKGVLFEFPVKELDLFFPAWVDALPQDHPIKAALYTAIRQGACDLRRIRDVEPSIQSIQTCEEISRAQISSIDLGKGIACAVLELPRSLFYHTLSQQSGFQVKDDGDLVCLLTQLAQVKTSYDKVADALREVEETGYGIVVPSIDALVLEEPEIVKQGGRYGVRLKASAPSIHIVCSKQKFRMDVLWYFRLFSPVNGSFAKKFHLLIWNVCTIIMTEVTCMAGDRTYIAIDLKSFYASVECVQRGLDPLTTNLVVADPSRTSKTICLAVSPALKQYGISGRSRLFEVVQQVARANAIRRQHAPEYVFRGNSWDDLQLRLHPELEISYITAPPQMALYLRTSTQVYEVYLKYVAPEDIHVYSIDEVFIDATNYLRAAGLTGEEFARTIILDVLATTGITATAGIGSNLFLSKVAMDIVAKRIPADQNGVRIALLDEERYRQTLWDHRPMTDIWRVGRGYAKKLAACGIYTMGDVARCSLENEALLYKLFGVNAELLIDHAWGWEPCTMEDIKSYRPHSNSITSGQVLHSPYTAEKARLVLREMADQLSYDLVDRGLVTDQIVLTVGYDIENLTDPARRELYRGPVTVDHYGRSVPKSAHGSARLTSHTASTKEILHAAAQLFDRITDPALLVRRLNLSANHALCEKSVSRMSEGEQLDLFTDYGQTDNRRERDAAVLERERRRQRAVLSIRQKFGKNAILKGMDLEEGATTRARNEQIGGHKA